MPHAMVNLDNVCREYDKGRIQAVRSVSLQIHYGEFVAICGASGSGKSTLLNLMTGLDMPTRGRVLIDGVSPVGSGQWSKLRATKFGFIFQGYNLLPTLTALENIMVPMFGVRKTALGRRKKAVELLERVGLSGRADHLPTELSGGERQRVAIARGLANGPDILVADEPTGNLDRHTSDQIMELITEIHRVESRTIVLVTHDHRFVNHAERVLNMSDGKLVDSSGD